MDAYDYIIRKISGCTYNLRDDMVKKETIEDPVFFPLYIEIFSNNPLLYKTIDAVYNKNVNKHYYAALKSKLYNSKMIEKKTFCKSIYANKVIGILTSESLIEMLKIFLAKGWKRLYKTIITDDEISFMEMISDFVDFNNPNDTTGFVIILVCILENIRIREVYSPQWMQMISMTLSTFECFQAENDKCVAFLRDDKGNMEFSNIQDFRVLSFLFSCDDNDCCDEINRLLHHFSSFDKNYVRALFTDLMECPDTRKVTDSIVKYLVTHSNIKNMAYFSSLMYSCINQGLRQIEEYKECFQLYSSFNEVMNFLDMSPSVFYGIKYNRRIHINAQKRYIETGKQVDYLATLLFYTLLQTYQNQRKDAYVYSMLAPMNEVDNDRRRIAELENENNQLKNQLKELELRIDRHKVDSNYIEKINRDNKLLSKRVEALQEDNIEKKQILENLKEALQELAILLNGESIRASQSLFYNRESLLNISVCIIGGYANWRNNLKNMFPMWNVLDQDEARRNAIDENKYILIVFNIQGSSHALFYKILSNFSTRDKLLILNESNVEISIKKISERVGHKLVSP